MNKFRYARITRNFDTGAGTGRPQSVFRQRSSVATQAGDRQQPNGADTENQQATTQTDSQGQGNNASDHKQFLAELWQPDEANQQTSQQNNQGSQQQQPATNKPASLREHLDGINFGSGIDYREFQEQMREGNFEALEAGFKKAMEDTYVRAISDMLPEINQKIDAAVQKAVQTATDTVGQDKAVDRMNEALAFTKDEIWAPMANAVLQRAMSKGKTVEQAIEVVDFYFASMSEVTGHNKAPNNPGDAGFGGNSTGNSGANFDSLFQDG